MIRRSPRLHKNTADSTVAAAAVDAGNAKLDNATCLVYDERCMLHKRHDGLDHPERPERIKRIFDKLSDDGLAVRCIRLKSRMATTEEIQLVHDEAYLKELSETQEMGIDDLRLWQEKWNSIYACHDTWNASVLACGNLLECVDCVVSERALNGVAIIRPPGHHAESNLAYGFCFVNNVAVAAQYARKMLGVEKVVILDWDVHHGNGTQAAFYNDPNVLYISLHRYDNGRFFPTDEPNNFTDIGEGAGLGFNINIPWNGRGVGDSEYLEAFNKIVMPVAVEFKPDLVLVSAGFDAARGDPLGGYRVSPFGFAQMTAHLSKLAKGRIILALEGGYNLTSISESMAACVRVLLGEDPVERDEEAKPCQPICQRTISNVIEVLRPHWKCLAEDFETKDAEVEWTLTAADSTLRDVQSLVNEIQLLNIDVKRPFQQPPLPANPLVVSRSKTGLISDEEASSKHFCLWDPNHIECPARLSTSLKKIQERGLMDRCVIIEPRRADVSEICYYHDMNFVEQMSETVNWEEPQLESFSSKFDDAYVNRHSYDAALISAGSTMEAVKSILDGRCGNAMVLVRPPGHHAMHAICNGFCIFNNVVIATKMALDVYKLKRVLIVDWDVHHGQGTQRPFYDDPRVLYFSIHRYENGAFWPNLRESNWDFIGTGAGKGFNVNVPLNKIGLGDAEYLAIFTHILLPLANEFDPELVIVSAGYDAAVGCPEGQMTVSPLCYAHLTRMLMPLANGRLCVVLEGGYCVDSLAEGVAMTLRSLLCDYCPKLPSTRGKAVDSSLTEVLLNVAHELKDRWACMGALCIAVDSVLSKLERPHYVASKALYNWTPVEQTVFMTKNKYVARPADVVDQFRAIVDKMMASCKLEKTSSKLTVSATKQTPLVKKLRADDTGNELKLVDGNRHNIEEDLDFIRGAGYYKEWLSLFGVRGESEKKVEDPAIIFGTMLNAVDSVIKMESQCGSVLLADAPPVDFIHDVVRYAQRKDAEGGYKVLLIDLCDDYQDKIAQRFYDDNTILCISLHRYVWGERGQPENIGYRRGIGFNANLIWNSKSEADLEYLFALHHIILPLAYSFDPAMVIVVSDFSTSRNATNPSGSRFSPSFYAYFVNQVQMLAEGRLLILAQDDNRDDVSNLSGYACAKALLVKSAPTQFYSNRDVSSISPSALLSFMETVYHLRPYWPYLQCVVVPNPNIGQRPLAVEPTAGSLEELLQLPEQFSYVGSVYAVAVPQLDCPHTREEDFGAAVPEACRVNLEMPCDECGNVGENWICLSCWTVHCGRYINEHAMIHSKASGHPIALSMADLSTWCYRCENYIESDSLKPAKRLLHLVKFGIEMP